MCSRHAFALMTPTMSGPPPLDIQEENTSIIGNVGKRLMIITYKLLF